MSVSAHNDIAFQLRRGRRPPQLRALRTAAASTPWTTPLLLHLHRTAARAEIVPAGPAVNCKRLLCQLAPSALAHAAPGRAELFAVAAGDSLTYPVVRGGAQTPMSTLHPKNKPLRSCQVRRSSRCSASLHNDIAFQLRRGRRPPRLRSRRTAAASTPWVAPLLLHLHRTAACTKLLRRDPPSTANACYASWRAQHLPPGPPARLRTALTPQASHSPTR